jgi:vitamin B12 transporter
MSKKIFSLFAAFFSCYFIYSQDTTKITSLDEVVITANKYPQKQSTTGKVLMVISRDQLEKNTGRTLAQVLNEQAGLTVNGAQQPLGNNQTVYLRGALAGNTLILIDGVPANDASGISGEFDLNHFAIDQIERVEILKGSQSVLYGSDAMAGVINIITRKQGSNRKFGGNASVAAGTYGTFKGVAGIGGSTKIISYDLQYSHLQSDGFSAAHDEKGDQNFDRDGYNQVVVGLNVTAKATKNWKLRVYGQYGNYKADIDDAGLKDDRNNTIHNKNLQTGIYSMYDFNKGSFNASFNINNTERKLNDEKNVPLDPNDFDPFKGLYKSKTYFAEAFTNLNLHEHIGVLAGADLRIQKADIETSYGKLGKDSLNSSLASAYASFFLKELGGFNLELGGRFTNHSDFGSAFTYSVNPSYLISKQVKIFANLSSGFRAPTIYNLASEYGNKDLDPERSISYEGGIQYIDPNNRLNIRATYFDRQVKDVIIFKNLFTAPYGQYDNADKQKDHGVEFEIAIKPSEKWSITANYAYVDGKIETSSAATGKDTSFFNLIRRPKNTINFNIGFQATKKLFTSIGGRWVDKREDRFSNPATFATEKKILGSYYNLDAYAAYQVHKLVKLFVDLRNITDQQYSELYGYNTRQFNFMAGIVFKM